MTQRTASDATANWALEIERVRGKPEYVSAEAFEADGDTVTIYTTAGHEVTLKRDRIRKILLMRTAVVNSAE